MGGWRLPTLAVWGLLAAAPGALAQAVGGLPPGALAPLTSPVPRVLPQEQPEIVMPAAPPSQPGPPPTGAPVRVDRVVVEGATVYDEASLRASFADAVGRDVPRARLDAIVQALQTRYREDGYILTLVRGEFRRQANQVIFVVSVIEGYINQVKLDGDIGPAGTLVYKMLDHLTAKRPTNNADLERYLLLANDVPGVTVTAVLHHESDKPGAVTLIAQVARKPVSGLLNYDNRGSTEAGPSEMLLSGATNSFTSLGERVEALLFTTFNREQIFGQVNGDAFLGDDGIKARWYFGDGNNQPGGILAATGFNGDLMIGGGALSYPIVRSRRFNWRIETDLDTYQSTITLAAGGASTQSGSHLLMTRLGNSFDFQDAFVGDLPAASVLNIKFSGGLAGTSNLRPLNQVHFQKVSGDLTRVQDLFTFDDVRTALKLSVGGQYSKDILPPSEKFFLGGIQFGRGFFNGEVTGDRAIGSTVELQENASFTDLPLVGSSYKLSTQFYQFWDYGRGYNLAPSDISTTINSAGLGVRSDLTPWLFWEVEGVHRLTVHPQGADVSPEARYAVFTRVTMHY
ncbi:MAG TPA: ShlB/FhaC/HecB family hemolysin secretion/activation protein [Stellaceae bacterium]|jgi:hemolysin activation/secretion protein|nr:ShlB/FhaC/HecB family hemolysin secretion/activation protein [Stellaceae bacterium]